jgi:hypothetical protein
MAAGIKKIDDVYDSDWYKECVAKAERGNREHVARYDRSFAGIMAKADNRGNGDRNDDGDEIDRADGGNASHASKVANLLVEAGSHPDRASALSHLLHSPQGQALLARMHKKDDPPMTSTTHAEFVRDVVKQYGVVALAKSMVQDQKSYGLDEPTFTRLATEHAQRVYPNDRPDVAFSKLYQSEESVRRACSVLKSAAPYFDPQVQVVTGEDARAVNDPSAALAALHRIGRERWPDASEAIRFTRAFEANPELARKAHVRPSATTSYAWPR